VGGGDPDPRYAAACQRFAARHRHLVGEDPSRADNLPAIEHRQRPVELERFSRDGELFVSGER
jgi:hypothetical protein